MIMTDLYEFHQGTTPLLLSIPHAGTAVPEALLDRLSEPAKKLPDTDWVAKSLKGLGPVRAGRFLVHGSHDREARRPHEIAIEIDAGK